MASKRRVKKAVNRPEKAAFAAGCFWHVQDDFESLKGVKSTEVGYIGGEFDNPTYEDVCSDETGYAETVEIVFDPAKISYEKLLEVFWKIHDPTTPNRQGPDVGTQYRSVIFFYSKEQEKTAEKSKEELKKSGKFNGHVVTEMAPASTFWKAEDYHQHYLKKRGLSACTV